MSSGMRLTVWLPGAVAALLSVPACTTPELSPSVPEAPITTTARERLAQRGHGSEAVFALCRRSNCPRPTPKTLPGAPPVAESRGPAVTAAADGASTAAASGQEAVRAPVEASTSVPVPATPPPKQLSVRFPFASARLDASARAALRDAAERLAQADDITLSGRTDATGDPAANERLARARVQAVVRELARLVPGLASRATTEAQGGCCFIDTNDSPEGRAHNRRVEIRYRPRGDVPP